ncbi:MAG TPA: hypothetical protein VMW41_00860 [Candidatus Bathyarchaeia archaeon]|nr:hypothetical protein [Candidatus Bathyarchaeia archaeon]
MATQSVQSTGRYVRGPSDIRFRVPIRISPTIIRLTKDIRPKTSKLLYGLARKDTLRRLSQIHPEARPEVIRTQIKEAARVNGITFTYTQTQIIQQEIRSPHRRSVELPHSVKAKIETEKAKIVYPKISPVVVQLRSLSPTGRIARGIEKSIASLSEEQRQRLEPCYLHPAFQMMANGIFESDFENTIQELRKIVQDPATSQSDTRQVNQVIEQYQDIQTQLAAFRQYHRATAQALENVWEPARQAGLVDTKKVAEKLNLPHLENIEIVPKTVDAAKLKVRNFLGQKVAEPLGLVRAGIVKEVKLGAGKSTYRLAIKDAVKAVGKKAFIRFAQTAGGRALITFFQSSVKPLLVELGKKAVFLAAKIGAKIAAKFGLEISAAVLTAIIPAGVTQIAGILMLVYGIYDTVLSLIEAIPVIGRPLALLLDLSNPLGWARRLFKVATGFLTFRYLREGLKEGGFKGTVKVVINVLPLVLLAGIFLPILLPLIAIPLLVIGGLFLASRLGVTAIRTAGSLAALPGIIIGGIATLLLTPIGWVTLFSASFLMTFIYIFLGLVLLTVIIVVMLAGGAFMVNPAKLETESPRDFDLPYSRYIKVDKTAQPSSYTEEQLTQIWDVSGSKAGVDYTLTITAQEKDITVTAIEETFNSYPEGVPTPSSSINITLPLEIRVDTPFTYTYRKEFGKEYKDSSVINKIIVTANVADGPTGEQSGASASVTFGNAPTLCFVFDENWNETDKALEISAINYLSQWPNWVNLVCTDIGSITLKRSYASVTYGGYKESNYAIRIYDLGLGSFANTIYTLAHECGHMIEDRNSPYLMDRFMTQGIDTEQKDGNFCSYCYGFTSRENFAEMIGVFPVYEMRRFTDCCPNGALDHCEYKASFQCTIDYPNDFPNYYNFVTSEIYQP